MAWPGEIIDSISDHNTCVDVYVRNSSQSARMGGVSSSPSSAPRSCSMLVARPPSRTPSRTHKEHSNSILNSLSPSIYQLTRYNYVNGPMKHPTKPVLPVHVWCVWWHGRSRKKNWLRVQTSSRFPGGKQKAGDTSTKSSDGMNACTVTAEPETYFVANLVARRDASDRRPRCQSTYIGKCNQVTNY